MRARHLSTLATMNAALAGAGDQPRTAYLVGWMVDGKLADVGVYSEGSPTMPGPLNDASTPRPTVIATLERATYAEASRALLTRASRTMANGFRTLGLQLAEMRKAAR